MKNITQESTAEACKKLLGLGLALVFCLLAAQHGVRAAEKSETKLDPPLTASQVASRMVEMNQRRTQALRSYTSLRTYHLELHGLIRLHADMQVKMTYEYPGTKHFTIVSQSGSGYVRSHVFKRLLKVETETSTQRENREISITPHNYNFEMVGYKSGPEGDYYILKVTPKHKRKYLLDGRIWVSARSFAITHIEGKPDKRVSWWTPKVNFVYTYRKVGQFWFPALNRTITHVRIFGRSLLTIRYDDYNLTNARNFQLLAPVQAPQM